MEVEEKSLERPSKNTYFSPIELLIYTKISNEPKIGLNAQMFQKLVKMLELTYYVNASTLFK